MTATTHTIVGFFETRPEAEAAVQELVREGFSRDQVSLIAGGPHATTGTRSDAVDAPKLGPLPQIGSTEDVGEKAAIGGMAGAILGIAALAIPGVGPILAAGPIGAALAGAAMGAGAGSLIGVFTNDGVPEERAKHYTQAISAGHVLVSVHTTADRVDDVSDILDRTGAEDINETGDPIGKPVRVTTTQDTIRTAPLPESAVKFDPEAGVRAKQKARERHVDVYPGITGGGTNPS